MKIVVSLISVIAFLLVLLPGPLYKFGIVDLGSAFVGFTFSMLAGGIALIMLTIQALFKRETLTISSVLLAVTLSLIAIIIPLGMLSTAKSVPPIHDISTDMINPPQFVAIAPLRADAPNPVEYAGSESAEQQRDAYPDIQTLTYSQSQNELIEASEQAVNNLGWDLVNTDTSTGIVEATDTTVWFGFQDDVIVRVTDQGDERLLDIRSKSRIGGSDLGKNADRIRDFVKELDEVLGLH